MTFCCFLQWRTSSSEKAHTASQPVLRCRMKRREQKYSPARCSRLTEAQPATAVAKTGEPSGNRRKELTTRLILMLPLLPSRFRSCMVRRLRKYRVVYPPDLVPHSNPAPSEKQSQNLLADNHFPVICRRRESWLATCKVEADIIIPVYRGLEETRRCIASVLEDKSRPPGQIVVIDDCSPEKELSRWLDGLGGG